MHIVRVMAQLCLGKETVENRCSSREVGNSAAYFKPPFSNTAAQYDQIRLPGFQNYDTHEVFFSGFKKLVLDFLVLNLEPLAS